jgi:hypothetical protein
VSEPGWGVAQVLGVGDDELRVHYLGNAATEDGANCPYAPYNLLYCGSEASPWTDTVSRSTVPLIIDNDHWTGSGDIESGRHLSSAFLRWLGDEYPHLHSHMDVAARTQFLVTAGGPSSGSGGKGRAGGGHRGSSSAKRTAPAPSESEESDLEPPARRVRAQRTSAAAASVVWSQLGGVGDGSESEEERPAKRR